MISGIHKHLLSLAVALTVSLRLLGAPAQPGTFWLTQPDGYTFAARLSGDEFLHIMKTLSGESIILDDDGWYCYARYDWTGARSSSGVHVTAEAPSPFIQAAAANIPYSALSAKAERKRLQTDMLRAGKRVVIPREGTTEKHGIIILAEFNDLKFTYDRDHFEKLINSSDPGSAVSYYHDQFGGSVHFTFDISEIVTLNNGFAYYGKNNSDGDDSNAHEMIAEACRKADAEIDFSRYDDDEDGRVDNVFVYFAGGDEAGGAGDDHIWSHQHYLSTAGSDLPPDGKVIDNYACTSELVRGNRGDIMATIGTFCHEYLHTFGLPDYYDTDDDGSGGKAEALWKTTALLDSGNWNNYGKTPPAFNAVDRWLLGLGTQETLAEGTFILSPIDRSGQYLIYEGPLDGELYLFECRHAADWDLYIGGSGLLIYHIDRSTNTVDGTPAYIRWRRNSLNCVPSHQCIDLIEASTSAISAAEVFFPRSDNKSFTANTTPAFTWWDGGIPSIAITGILKAGEDIILTVGKASDEKAPDVTSVSKLVFQDAAVITWESSVSAYNSKSYISWSETGKTPVEYDVTPYQPGHYAYVMEGLEPGKSYSVSIYFKSGGVPGKESTAASLITKSFAEGSIPYIYMGSATRNPDGSIVAGSILPLRVCNAPSAEGVTWYYSNRQILVGNDGFFTVSASGTLRAEVHWKDGSKDIIERKITVK